MGVSEADWRVVSYIETKKSKDAKKAEPENDIKGEVFRENCFHYVE